MARILSGNHNSIRYFPICCNLFAVRAGRPFLDPEIGSNGLCSVCDVNLLSWRNLCNFLKVNATCKLSFCHRNIIFDSEKRHGYMCNWFYRAVFEFMHNTGSYSEWASIYFYNYFLDRNVLKTSPTLEFLLFFKIFWALRRPNPFSVFFILYLRKLACLTQIICQSQQML